MDRLERIAYEKGLEDAAELCDRASDLHANGPEWMDGCEFCASEIRELKERSHNAALGPAKGEK